MDQSLGIRLVIELVNGLTLGMILALVASGFTLILGVMNIVNFAHGEFYMTGAYLGWAASLLLGDFWLSMLVGGLAAAVLGLGVERSLLKPTLERGPLNSLLVTFGVSLILQQAALIVFGKLGKFVGLPVRATLPFFGLRYPVYRILVLVLCGLIILGLWAFVHRTRYGRWIRATIQNRQMAACMGVPVPRLYSTVFAIGCGLAGLSGVLVSPLFSVSSTMGLDIIIPSFIVVVVGGMGSLGGSLLAGILIGELETLASLFLKPSQASILSLVVLLLVLLFRPRGLFGTRGLLER